MPSTTYLSRPQPLDAQHSYSYLQAMGIKLWIPRVQLPNAAPSQQCAWQEAAPSVSNKLSLKAQKTLARSAAQAINAPAPKLRQQTQQQPAIQALANPTQVHQSAGQKIPQPTPNFTAAVQTPLNLRVQQLANSWLLILPSQLSPRATKLLQNLLLTLHHQTLGILQERPFSWPLPNLPSTPSQEEASLSLLAFLTGVNFNQPKPQGCLVFAPATAHLLPRLQQTRADFFYSAPCLEELLSNPRLKQSFWQQAQTNGLLTRFKASWINI